MLWTPKKRFLITRQYSPPESRAKEILHRLGQLANLTLLLDAGDSDSIGVSATKWLDLSGNGYDFNFGSGSGADAADPTFNGVPGGKSFAEYLSFDGGDYLTYDTANEAWMHDMHQNSALFSMYSWVFGSGFNLNNSIFGTSGNNVNNVGVYMRAATDVGSVRFEVQDGSGTAALIALTAEGIYRAGQWNFIGMGVDEAAGNIDFVVNWYTARAAGTYTSPSTGNASFAMQIGARGNAQAAFTPDGRMGQMAFWTRFLSRNELLAIRDATAGRYMGLTTPW
jgi:hypothetical protein